LIDSFVPFYRIINAKDYIFMPIIYLLSGLYSILNSKAIIPLFLINIILNSI
jgi:hypothetical protein